MREKFNIPANDTIRVTLPAVHIFVENVSVLNAEFDIVGKGVLPNGTAFTFEETLDKGGNLGPFPVALFEWELKNKTASDLEVTLKANLVPYRKNEIAGDVNSTIVNNYKADISKSSLSFVKQLRFDGSINNFNSAAAARYGACQLYNPADSGRNMIIERVRIFSDFVDADYYTAGESRLLIPMYLTDHDMTEDNYGSAFPPLDKSFNGGVSVALMRGTVSATTYLSPSVLGVNNGMKVNTVHVQSKDSAFKGNKDECIEWGDISNLVVRPGTGFLLAMHTPIIQYPSKSQPLQANIEWYEESVS